MKDELTKLGLETTGKKADLVARLTEALQEPAAADEAAEEEPAAEELVSVEAPAAAATPSADATAAAEAVATADGTFTDESNQISVSYYAARFPALIHCSVARIV